MLDAALVDFTHTPPLVSGPLFAVLFWWLATALGRRLLRLLRLSLTAFDVWERGLISAAIGGGALQWLPLTLSVFGHLRPLEIRLALAALAAALVPDLWTVVARFTREISQVSLRRPSGPAIVWSALFLVLMGVLLVRSVTFGPFGDDDGIHLAAPKRWLHAGTLSYLPTYSLTNATLGFDMLYLIALSVWSPIGAKMLHYSAGLFAFFAIALCGRRIVSPIAGMLAISLLLVVTPLWNLPIVFPNAMIDLASIWMTMTSVLVWLVWRVRGDDRRLLVCMALCAGFAASFKMTSIQVAIAWVPILAVEARMRGSSWGSVAWLPVAFGLVTLAPVLPWLARNALLTGNPLYPMLSGWIPTRDWPAAHAVIFSRYVRYYAWGVRSGARLGESQRKHIILLAEALLVSAGLVTPVVVRDKMIRSLLVFAMLFILISVALTGIILRYWLPATTCVALVAGVFAARRWSSGRVLAAASLLLLMALTIQVRGGFYFHLPLGFRDDLRMAVGASTFEREYAREPIVNVWKYINANTPPDARVLLAAFYTTFGASSYAGFWLDRTCYATDSHLQAYLPLDDWAAFKASIAREGITYIVVATRQFSPGRLGYSFVAEENEYPFSRRLAREYGERVYQAGELEVYRLSQRHTVRYANDSVMR